MKKPFLSVLVALLGALTFCAYGENAIKSANEIRVGKAGLELRMTGNRLPTDKLTIGLGMSCILGNAFETEDYLLTESEDGVYRIDVPTDTRNAIGVLKINNTYGKTLALGLVELQQDSTLVLECNFTTQDSMTVKLPDKNGFNDISKTAIGDGFSSYLFLYEDFFNLILVDDVTKTILHGITDSSKVCEAGADAWKEVLRQSDEVFLPIINNEKHNELFDDAERTLYRNNLKYFIYSSFYIRYDKQRGWWAPKGNRDMPPLQYYSFLNNLDYDKLLDFIPFYSPQHLTKKILLHFPIKINPIGDEPVGQWKAETKEKLNQVIDSVPDLLLNLLSATSYNIQVEDSLTPLTPRQIQNISEGYNDDLGKILLARNDKLVKDLAQSTNIHDLTAVAKFDLKAFIDKNYPGKPVIVDFWNTWCGPCLSAHKQVAPIKQMSQADGVVFVYVSDTSSNEKERKQLTPRIGGEHILLKQDVSYDFLESESLTGFPSYLFFDKDHKLIHKQTSFPGNRGFVKLLFKIIGNNSLDDSEPAEASQAEIRT